MCMFAECCDDNMQQIIMDDFDNSIKVVLLYFCTACFLVFFCCFSISFTQSDSI